MAFCRRLGSPLDRPQRRVMARLCVLGTPNVRRTWETVTAAVNGICQTAILVTAKRPGGRYDASSGPIHPRYQIQFPAASQVAAGAGAGQRTAGWQDGEALLRKEKGVACFKLCTRGIV
jgi:hypothetical protein